MLKNIADKIVNTNEESGDLIALELPAKRDRLLARNLVTGITISTINGFLLAGYLVLQSKISISVAWFFILIATNIARSILARKLISEKRKFTQTEYANILIMTTLGGAVWGLFPFLISPNSNPAIDNLAYFIIAGMTAASALAYSTHFSSVIAFNTPILILLGAHFLIVGSTLEYAMGGFLLFYFFGIGIIARRTGEIITSAMKNEILATNREKLLQSHKEQLDTEIKTRLLSEKRLEEALSQTRLFNDTLDHLYASYILGDRSISNLIMDVTEKVSQSLRVERVSIWTFTPDKETIICKDLYENSLQSHRTANPLSAKDYPAYFDALRASRIIDANYAQKDFRTSEFTEKYLKPLKIHSMLDAPICGTKNLQGVICCETVNEMREWTTDEIAFVSAVAQFISIGLISEEMEGLSTELKCALVEAQKANHAKSLFLATMSHEIRTPLNGVLGAASILSKRKMAPDELEFVNIINECGTSLMNVLNDILDVTKLEVGKIELEVSEFQLDDIIHSINAIYSLKAKEKGIIFKVRVDDDVETKRIGDAHRITQILHNLIGNALKFTEEGTVELSVSAAPQNLEGLPAIQISISDTGMGIAEDQIGYIFDSFKQADASTTRRFGGTGLGLFIVKGIVEAMQGYIEVKSELEHGSTFKVIMPLRLANEFQTAETEALTDADSCLAGTSILIAEDNSTNRMILAAYLDEAEANVSFAENGKIALEAYKTGAYDVILMDIHMPEMDGVEALRKIRSIELSELRKFTPVIAVTADAIDYQVKEYLDVGFTDHISKPVCQIRLIQTIARNINRQTRRITTRTAS